VPWQRRLILFLSSRLFSTLAFHMQSVAIGWQVYDITHDPLSLGFVGLVQFVPVATLALVAGQVADRFNRQKVAAACIAVSGMISALFWILAHHHIHNMVLIYILLFTMGVVRAFFSPTMQAFTPSLVPHDFFQRAVAYNASLWQFSSIVGPALGGLIYGLSTKATAVYMVATGLSVLGFFLFTMIRVPKEVRQHVVNSFEEITAGIRFVWKHRPILGSISLDLFAVLLGGAVALMPAIARDLLHTGPEGLGFLRAAPGVGAALMGLYIGWRPIETMAGKKMFAAVFIFGAATVVFGLSKSLWVSMVALAVLGAADVVSVVVRQTLTQIKTPHHMRGRVSAVNFIFISASNELGEFESGVMAAWLGLTPSVIIGGIGTCLVAFLWMKFFPELYELDHLRGHPEPPHPPLSDSP
jgi:MFS family permease